MTGRAIEQMNYIIDYINSPSFSDEELKLELEMLYVMGWVDGSNDELGG